MPGSFSATLIYSGEIIPRTSFTFLSDRFWHPFKYDLYLQMRTTSQLQALFHKKSMESCIGLKIQSHLIGRKHFQSEFDCLECQNMIQLLLNPAQFNVANISRLKLSTIKAEKYDEYDLELIDSDLSSWEAGDRLVIASTDYDYEQAEEVTVQSVDGNKVKVKGNQKFNRKLEE